MKPSLECILISQESVFEQKCYLEYCTSDDSEDCELEDKCVR